MMKKFFVLLLIFAMSVAMAKSLFAIPVNSSETVTINDGGYVSGVFKAVEDDWSCVITLKSDGSFVMDEEGEPSVYGTYTLSDRIERGGTVSINIYVDGSKLGQGTLAWPLEDGLCIIIDGAIFYKQ